LIYTIRVGETTFGVSAAGEVGASEIKDKIVPFLQVRGKVSVEHCMAISDNLKHQLCLDLVAAVAAGLIQVEASAGGGISYKYKIANNGSKVFARVGGEAVAGATVVGGQSYSQGGAGFGVAF
jgi:hypothetical protein